jgi:hypothetical protein
MALSWTEIRSNALAFSREWAKETSEDAEAKSFRDAFFQIFGVSRRRIASFEEPVRKSDGSGGYIDLLWRGVLLVEHKSRGKDLKRAFHQATDYFYGLKDRDLPKYVLVSDFARFRLYDLDEGTEREFALHDLHKHIGLFGFVAGYQTHKSNAVEEAASIRAAEQLGKLHDQLKAAGYEGHPVVESRATIDIPRESYTTTSRGRTLRRLSAKSLNRHRRGYLMRAPPMLVLHWLTCTIH